MTAPIWGSADIAVGTEQHLTLGDLTMSLRREPEELWTRHRYTDRERADEDVWTRWSATHEDRYEIRPALPNRSIVVSPEQPFVLGPRQRSRIFVRVPLFARLARTDDTGSSVVISELPSAVLSDTWWGDFVDGELAYWVKTRARRAIAADVFEAHLAVCPFVLENESSEPLPVDRFAVRVAYLTLFGRESEIWTDEVRVRYEGAEEGSEIHYSGRLAEEANDVQVIAHPPAATSAWSPRTDVRAPPGALGRTVMLLPPVLQEAAESGSLESLTTVGIASAIRALAMVGIGLPLVFVLSKWVRRWGAARLTPQSGLIAGKVVFYVGLATVLVTTMIELGFSLTPLLGAAGVVGIALGFASQTSVSNVIAGLFLIAESPFVVDDLIQVGDVTGRVLSVDTMSVKLRTLDNKFVRIPNETLVKSVVTNITRFPIRRLDVHVGVAYKEDPERVRVVLLGIADENPLALMEPEPIAVFEGFGESSMNIRFGVWTVRENWLELKNSIQEEVHDRFAAEGIEIPFPHRSIYVGTESGAFPVRLVDEKNVP